MPEWTTLQSGYGIIHRSVMKEDMSRGAKLVYALLCSYANSETAEAFPSQETMSNDLRCSEKPIREWLDELVEHGKIVRRLEGMPAHNVYTVLYPVQSGSTLPNKTGSTVPSKRGSTLPAKKTNEKDNGQPPAPKGGAAPLENSSPPDELSGYETGRTMTEEEFNSIAASVIWNRKNYRE